MTPALDRLDLPASTRLMIDRELPKMKMAGARLDAVSSSDTVATTVRAVIDRSFVSAFRLVMLAAAVLALAAAAVGAAIR